MGYAEIINPGASGQADFIRIDTGSLVIVINREADERYERIEILG